MRWAVLFGDFQLIIVRASCTPYALRSSVLGRLLAGSGTERPWRARHVAALPRRHKANSRSSSRLLLATPLRGIPNGDVDNVAHSPCSLTVGGNARGAGVTCYSHNGKDLYCNKPAAGSCFTTGGWCPPDFGGDDEVLPTEGVSRYLAALTLHLLITLAIARLKGSNLLDCPASFELNPGVGACCAFFCRSLPSVASPRSPSAAAALRQQQILPPRRRRP